MAPEGRVLCDKIAQDSEDEIVAVHDMFLLQSGTPVSEDGLQDTLFVLVEPRDLDTAYQSYRGEEAKAGPDVCDEAAWRAPDSVSSPAVVTCMEVQLPLNRVVQVKQGYVQALWLKFIANCRMHVEVVRMELLFSLI